MGVFDYKSDLLAMICFLYNFGFHEISSKHAEPVDNDSCEDRKGTVADPITSGSGTNVIVLNPVDDSVCNLRCNVGWYEATYGNAAPFLCAPQTADRTSREGIPTNPIACASKCVVCGHEAFSLAYFIHM